MRFFVNKKSGFKTTDKLLIINDSNNNIFYYKENQNGVLNFNLPIGEYLTNNSIQKSNIVNYKTYYLPRGKFVRRKERVFKVYFCENKHKCSIDMDTLEIFFDNSFKQKPKVVIDYILGHERGHLFYNGNGETSEQLCDMFSYNSLIDMGYNPSQIYYAQKNSLSNAPDAITRKNIIFNQAKKG